MSKGSAIISIMIAFVGGLVIGSFVTAGGGGGGEELAEITDGSAGSAEAADVPLDDDVARRRVEINDNMPQKGPDDALVTIVEFSDFQCPFCSRVTPTISRLMNAHQGQVRVLWRDKPLPMHPQATPAAEAAREAYAQGGDDKFWEMHDLLFENQRALSNDDLRGYAQRLGLDMARYDRAMEAHTHRAAVQADSAAADTLGARGTPFFFINGRELRGAQPYEAFETIVAEEIATAQRLVRGGARPEQLYATFMRNASDSAPAQPAAAQNNRPQPRQQPDPNAIYRVPIGDSPVQGSADALVTIVEFSEFQCPFCNRVQPTLEQVRERYGDDVRLIFKHNPLPFHPLAQPAAEAANEVLAQRGPEAFYRFHDIAFENQRELSEENIRTWAQQVGVDMRRFDAAMEAHTHREAVQADARLAQSLGARGTPYFFINGKSLRGAQPFPAFQAAIDDALSRARAALAEGTPRGRLYESMIEDGATSPQTIEAPGAAAAPQRPAAPPADQRYEIAVPRNAPSKGGRNASVTIQIFSDFECPFCGRVLPTMRQIEETYGNRIRLVWRNFPLPFHQNAFPAAEAAMEVYAQGGNAKFWAYHDVLFQHQRELTRANLEQYAQDLGGIDMARFRRALDNRTHQAAVQADMDAVNEAGARIGTPSFFINGRLVQGAQPFPAFQAAIDAALED